MVSRLYRVCFTQTDPNHGAVITYQRQAFLLDTNLQILRIYSLENLAAITPVILEDIRQLFSPVTPQTITQRRAPVLFIPQVFDQQFCQDLIQRWETQGNKESGAMHREGDRTVKVLDYDHKIRRDHSIKDPELKKRIDQIMQRRVFPEIQKVHHFEVTHREHYKVVRYDGYQGGYFRRHRDNTTGGTAHRKFAMTINLNVGEYQGGCLRFPEYDQDLYQPETGSALIFFLFLDARSHGRDSRISLCIFIIFLWGKRGKG